MQGASVRDARTSTSALEPDAESGKSTSFARLTDEVLGPTQRGVRNVLRSPVRLVLVAAILGISLMFVAVMVDLNASVQQRLSTAQSNIGTGITIRTAGSGGFIFQSYYLIPNLTAMENVMLPMEVAGVPRRERGDRAASLLDQVGLPENRYHHRPNKLSGGQQQRVAVARALANDPAVILADEPTGNLDSNNSKRLVSLLRSLARQGRTIIMVTHDRGIARLADVRMDLVDGRIIRMTTQTQTVVQSVGRSVSEPAAKRRKKGRSGR